MRSAVRVMVILKVTTVDKIVSTPEQYYFVWRHRLVKDLDCLQVTGPSTTKQNLSHQRQRFQGNECNFRGKLSLNRSVEVLKFSRHIFDSRPLAYGKLKSKLT